MKYAVGIDVGGTNTRVALINEEYKILERIKFSTDSKDPEVTLQKIGEIIKGFAKEDGWKQINATRDHMLTADVAEGQEVLIVIGENLQKERIETYLL